MRLKAIMWWSSVACVLTIGVVSTGARAGGDESDADAEVMGSTLIVTAALGGGSSDPSAGGGGADNAPADAAGGDGSSSSGGSSASNGWDWSRFDTGVTYDADIVYEGLTLFLGDLERDGVTYRLFAGDSPNQPGGVNELAWVGPQQPQAVQGAQAPPVPVPTAADILPGLRDRLQTELRVPEVRFVGLDPEFGWAYVVVPVGLRVSNADPVSVTASVSAAGVTAWATITATPTKVRFEPGEPGGRAVICAAAQARSLAFDSANPDPCSYVYDNSSAIALNGRSFSTTTSMMYEIAFDSSDGSGSFPAVTLSSTAELAVAEVQALVTCTGPRAAQGGCG